MSDLISRQAAIDAINARADEVYETKRKGATYPHDDLFQGMAYAVDIVKRVPSAQPERKMVDLAMLTVRKWRMMKRRC